MTSGNDPSFFYRVLGPALAGIDIMTRYPFAGAGLTGEPFIEQEITILYLRSRYYSAGWQIVSPATELLINYFWLHWVYLGLIWGLIMMVSVSAWLRVLGVPSVAFCWMVWAILARHRPPMWADMLGGAVPRRRRRRPPPAQVRRQQEGPAGDASDGLRPSKSRLGHRELTGRRCKAIFPGRRPCASDEAGE